MENAIVKLWEDVTSTVPVWQLEACIGLLLAGSVWQFRRSRISLPTYGGFVSFSRVLSLLRMGTHGREEILRAYAENPMVITPRLDDWVILAHSKYVDELNRAPDDVLSFMDAATEMVQMRHTFGHNMVEDHYHHGVVRNQLTRNLSNLCPDVFDETSMAVSECVSDDVGAWTTIKVFSFVQQVVARASNRIFVGVPLCRDEEWLALNISAVMDVIKVATFINLFPPILRPIVGWMTAPAERRAKAATKLMGPYVEERLGMSESERPNDLISWIISCAPPNELNPKDITVRLLSLNFAAIHTSSMSVTHAIYWLLAKPQYIEPLLGEITEATERLGWTKEAISAMPKLDSFMKECMRMSPVGTQVMSRKALKPFTFSDGFTVPKGMTVSAHLYATHYDENNYPDANTFDGFRFVDPTHPTEENVDGYGNDAEKEPVSKSKKTMYTTSRTYLAFGHGRHACPGRFFAAMEVKLILAHLIFNYEMRWPEEVYKGGAGATQEGGGYRPPDIWFGPSLAPNTNATMQLRKRAAA